MLLGTLKKAGLSGGVCLSLRFVLLESLRLQTLETTGVFHGNRGNLKKHPVIHS